MMQTNPYLTNRCVVVLFSLIHQTYLWFVVIVLLVSHRHKFTLKCQRFEEEKICIKQYRLADMDKVSSVFIS